MWELIALCIVLGVAWIGWRAWQILNAPVPPNEIDGILADWRRHGRAARRTSATPNEQRALETIERPVIDAEFEVIRE